jgi:hypothetical protein
MAIDTYVKSYLSAVKTSTCEIYEVKEVHILFFVPPAIILIAKVTHRIYTF